MFFFICVVVNFVVVVVVVVVNFVVVVVVDLNQTEIWKLTFPQLYNKAILFHF